MKNDCSHSFNYKYEDYEINMEFCGNASMDDIIIKFKSYLLAVGFHPDTVSTYLDSED